MDRNPCLSCDLRDEDKNSRRCMDCDDRVKYVSGLVGRAHASPEGYAGQAQPQQTKKENKMTILEEKVEEIIKEVCAEEGVELSKLREGKHFKKYSQARKRIAERLVANYGMSKQKIGELTGVSNQAIYYLLKKNQASLPASGFASQLRPDRSPRQGKEKGKTTDAVDILHKRYVGDDAERRASLQAEREKIEPKPEKTVTIDFSGHAKALEQLEKYAKEEIRSVPDQILYFIQTSLSWVESEAKGLQE